MKQLFKSLALYFLAALAIFLFVQKPIFFFYNWTHGASACSFGDVINMYRHGLRLDLATSAYITAIPALLTGVCLLIRRLPLKKIWTAYNAIIAIVLALITLADAALYEFWEFKLDSTVFMYINDPKNAVASVSVWYVIGQVLAWIVLSVVYWALLQLPVRKLGKLESKLSRKQLWCSVGGFVVTLAALFGFIRGLDVWPNNPGVAFYSKTLFHNHVALNPAFNVIYSITRTQSFADQYNFMDDAKCNELMAPLYPTKGNTTTHLLNKPRPNVLVIVLEGMGACFVENLGGMKEVAPCISRLCTESVNFTHAYCSSFRTDRGIVAALSGYPGQPNTSIMRYSNKVQNLPGLPKWLKNNGYSTQVLYASDATFFNMSGYFITAGHDKLMTQDDFPASDRTTKWGVPDHVAFNWLLGDLQKQDADKSKPHYNTMLTISSHTPFDVPYHKLADEKLNSFAYTDSCVGNFIEKLKVTPAWDNLMIVITADHGFNHKPVASPEFAHVPFLILGGAVNTPQTIDTIMCQTDLPAIVLGQLGIDHSDFTFSRDVLADTYKVPFAINTFNDGFTVFDNTGCTVYDNKARRAIYGSNEHRTELGKAFLQRLYDDLDKR